MEMSYERLEDREVNTVEVTIGVESGCNPFDGEYSLHIAGFIGALDIGAVGGVDDVSLIKDCIENNLEELPLPEEGHCSVTLEESGEWEDVFWHKYYIVKKAVKVIY